MPAPFHRMSWLPILLAVMTSGCDRDPGTTGSVVPEKNSIAEKPPSPHIDAVRRYRDLCSAGKWDDQTAARWLNDLAARSPLAALNAIAAGDEPSEHFDQAVTPGLAMILVKEEPFTALGWVNDPAGPDILLPKSFFSGLADTLRGFNPDSAVKALPTRGGFLRDRIEAARLIDPAKLSAAQVAAAPPGFRAYFMARRDDLEGAITDASALPVGADRRTALGFVANAWSRGKRRDPIRTVEIATRLHDLAGDGPASVPELTRNLSDMTNLPEIYSWLAALPPSPQRDAEILRIAEFRARTHPDSADRWIASVTKSPNR